MTDLEQLQELKRIVNNLDSEVRYGISNAVWSLNDDFYGVEALRNESEHIEHHLQTLLETIEGIQRRIKKE